MVGNGFLSGGGCRSADEATKSPPVSTGLVLKFAYLEWVLDFLTFARTDDHDQLYLGWQKSDEKSRWWPSVVARAYAKVRVRGVCIILCSLLAQNCFFFDCDLDVMLRFSSMTPVLYFLWLFPHFFVNLDMQDTYPLYIIPLIILRAYAIILANTMFTASRAFGMDLLYIASREPTECS